MREPTPRRILGSALAAMVAAVGILTIVTGFSTNGAVAAVQLLTVVGLGAVIIVGVIVLGLVHLADWRAPEEDFELVVRRAERLAVEQSWGFADAEYPEPEPWEDEFEFMDFSDPEDFRALLRSVIDELPAEFHRALEHVAVVVVVAEDERVPRKRRHVYSAYQSDSLVDDYFNERILIYQEALVRDFGHNGDLLREQLLRSIERELSHHLGWDGNGVPGTR